MNSDKQVGNIFQRITRIDKRVLLMIGLGLLAVGAGLFALYARTMTKQPVASTPQYSRVCDADTIKQASSAIASIDMQRLNDITKKVASIPKYDGDSNCLYILTRAALLKNDATEARKRKDQLTKVYRPYSNDFTIPTYTPEQLEPMVRSSEEIIKKFQDASAKDSAAQNSAADKALNGGEQ